MVTEVYYGRNKNELFVVFVDLLIKNITIMRGCKLINVNVYNHSKNLKLN